MRIVRTATSTAWRSPKSLGMHDHPPLTGMHTMTDSLASLPDAPPTPKGELSIRTLAMPADTNQHGDIFGGWVLGQMDVAGGIFAAKIAKGRCATVAVDAMTFRKPVYIGDIVCVYTSLIRVGTTSVTVRVEAWVIRRNETASILVTEGNFTFVAIDDQRRPRPISG
jgi:acyl-CoA thioesterase YciA